MHPECHSLRPSENTPIFVVGSPRSGTTLLYHLLIAADPFPIYMAESRVMTCSEYYGNLTEKSRSQFLNDFFRSRQFARSGLDEKRFRRKVDVDAITYVDFLRIFMDEISDMQGKVRWVEKTPGHLRHMNTLAETFDTAKFIHMVRDGRDVALSMRKLRWTHEYGGSQVLQLLEAAKRWEEDVQQARRSRRRLPDRVLEIKYEDFVADPDHALERVGAFADVSLSLRPPRSAHADSLQAPNTAFPEKMEGISDEAVGRWRVQLTTKEQAALHAVVGDSLREFDYHAEPCDTSVDLIVRLFTAVYPVLTQARRRLKRLPVLSRFSDSPLEIGVV